MRFSFLKSSSALLLGGFLVFLFSAATWAEADGLYLRFDSVCDYLRLNKGESCVYGKYPDYYYAVPELKEQVIGYGLTIGKQEGRLGGELTLSHVEHEASFTNSTYQDNAGNNITTAYDIQNAVSNQVGLNVKYAFQNPQDHPFVVYGIFGVSYEDFCVKGGAMNASGTTRGDADFSGYGYNLGLGASYRFSEKWAAEASYVYGMMNISTISGLGSHWNAAQGDPVEFENQMFRVGINYFF